ALAETGEQLSAWESGSSPNLPPNGDIVLVLKEGGLTTTPAGRLLYYPFPSSLREAPTETFAETEQFEFSKSRPEVALSSYQKLAASADPSVRAGALVRMARVLRNTSRTSEALAVYTRLAAVQAARVAGTPADLIAIHALADLSPSPAQAAALRAGLLQGRWHLTRGQFEFYWSEANRLADRIDAPPASAVALSEVASLAWSEWHRNTDLRGQETVWVSGHPFFLLSRGAREHRAVLVARPDSFLRKAVPGTEAKYAIVDVEGRVLAGARTPNNRAAIRTAAEGQLPWTLYVDSVGSVDEAGALSRQRFLVLGISIVVVFLILGTYFIARAIRRETETLRMQSDFVSAVSHEFRSPLTSMRQLSEILALGRVPSEERRQLYYETLVKESTRLQRLIETLLNFGKMEAGARQYRFEELDASQLVRRVVSEIEPQIAGSGRHIEVHGADAGCMIDADPDAIGVALRNLVDNALKYSPGCPTVWVDWKIQKEHIAIEVRDRGRGIADSERKAIFRKFVRGTAAAETNVKGSGIGLAMVRHIVAAHGGEITLASQPGEGSAFTMLLPLVGRA
ncbi:MAG: HAMP domain-containing sensor histidine kinase, partial [Bryobacteraceae bacterium]